MSQLKELLENIYRRIQERPDLEESEVTDVFTDYNFFEELGYEGIPIDVRSENHIVGGDRPDYFAKDKYGNVIFVVEFKKPSRSEDLASHTGQLWEQYVVPLRAKYGILTNGEELILYERVGRNRRERKYRAQLDSLLEEQLTELEQLEKPDYEFESVDDVESYFSTADTVSVGELVEGEPVGRNEFLDTFRLEKNTLFYEMLEQTYELLDYYLEQEYSAEGGTFPRDAYQFWQSYYASDPSWYDLPEEWRDIAGSASNKQKVMFAVETVQSMLGRLMLAKACEDYEFPNVSISEHIEDETIDFRGQVEPVSHVQTGRSLMWTMREELVESVFEQDIYYWWTQPAEEIEELSARDIAEEDWPAEYDEFGKSLIEFTITMARFDFSSIRGDPLGELYQQYFDPKTRRALGEFYTPPSVCDYIVESTGYGDNVQYERLIDPACGSGTFLMAALDRYQEDMDGDDLPAALQDLCNRARIVGLDIHPFAVVLAQIRFMLEILEDYKRAIEAEPNLVLRRLPIFRTDSLLDESRAQEGVQQSLSASYGGGKVEFTMPLPIRNGDGAEFESMDFEFPQFGHVQSITSGEISNQQQYFSALCAVFDAVKAEAEDESYEISSEELIPYFYDYFTRERSVEQIASVFHDTANEFLETIRALREEYNDGRLLKLIEDVVLGATLKNDIKYDYVVGNPPWVAKQSRHEDTEEKRQMQELYLSAWKETDPYLQFMERGLDILKIGGNLGFLVSNRYLKNQGGKEIRAFLAKNNIQELIDFTDYQLFEDATNYSSLIVVEKEVYNDDWESFIENDKFTDTYEISATRVRDWDDSVSALVEQIRTREPTESVDFFEIDSRKFQVRVYTRSGRVETEELSETFEGKFGEITLTRNLPLADVWPVASPEEFRILNQIEDSTEMRLGDKNVIRNNKPVNDGNLVGDDIRVGIQTSGDGAYVVYPTTGIVKEKLHELDRLTITPEDIDETYTVETGLMKLDITGEDADRWLPNWNNRLVFVPYIQGDNRAELIKPTKLAESYPLTWEYFTDEEVLKTLSDESNERENVHIELASQLGVFNADDEDNSSLSPSQYRKLSSELRSAPSKVQELDNNLWWYRYMRRQNIESLPKPKLLTGNQAQRNKLSFDDAGIMAPHNARVYAILAEDSVKHALAAVLNSEVVDFFHKQHSRIHKGDAYSYIEDYTSKWPVNLGSATQKRELKQLVKDILELKDLEIKVPQFPDPYIADARESGEEFAPVSYAPSSSYIANPSLDSDLSGGFTVTLEDGGINHSAIDTRTKADYVVEALSGRSLSANESVTIPLPLDDNVASDALRELEEDQETLASDSISDIEEEIDDIVFGLYGIDSDRHREMIHRYNKQYEKVQKIDPEF
ncbi:adenine-specific DNA methylase [Halalkaliarchaeum desulfuricum]|uniref:site-specific DNA-methyltransferase (adenine-specific) n=1 Tax=Halalkaliarchaeum desulfuricum TaxID=2055893 RepID=A0A343TIK8_9EURY|nr:N-6 DNA methylase [Halalkaliarchaeum desulfuricum]AUX08930.1 adenine-specific DNA methylase [Halalkaliarchaeum desulfuricum]